MLSVPLREMVRERRPRARSVRLRPIGTAPGLAADLRAIYEWGVDEWGSWAQSELVPMYEQPAPLVMDATAQDLLRVLRSRGVHMDLMVTYQTQRLARWVTRVGEWHGQRTIRAVVSAVGVDVSPYIRLADVQDTLAQAVLTNTNLITGVSQDVREQLARVVLESFALRRTKREFVREIARVMGVAQRRARFIAEDQMSKLSSLLTQIRQQQLGFSHYIWRTRGDDRVRPLHRQRDGRVFPWDTPPSDGHPGWPIRCRCVAEAYMDLGV